MLKRWALLVLLATVSLAVSVGLTLYFHSPFFLLFLMFPFGPLLWGRHWGPAAPTVERNVPGPIGRPYPKERLRCPLCGYASDDRAYVFCPRCGGTLERL